ncbi:MAG: radical SAM protein [Lachnospiraceae bacterium]|nr:radical SAM protein [Lachnospiraceae bacterium]
MSEDLIICPACPHHCRLKNGETGLCRARKNTDGRSESVSYGLVTSIALDPIEKKPLFHFHPGSKILSVGGFGCNLSCPFCQNHDISQKGMGQTEVEKLSPEDLLELALKLREKGNIGAAFTYNEPLTGYEYVRDSAVLLKEKGLCTAVVTNGNFEREILDAVLPFIDAFNIDLKGFSKEAYDRLGGDFETVKAFIIQASEKAHVEITSLIVTGINDGIEEMEKEAEWIASVDPGIPLHINRYFPRYRYHEPSTDINLLYEMKKTAEKYLKHVYVGNV